MLSPTYVLNKNMVGCCSLQGNVSMQQYNNYDIYDYNPNIIMKIFLTTTVDCCLSSLIKEIDTKCMYTCIVIWRLQNEDVYVIINAQLHLNANININI